MPTADTNTMKILHIIDSGGLYGAENVLLNLAEQQVQLGLEPEIASLGRKEITEKPIEREARAMGLPVSVFRMRRGPNLSGMLRVRRYALENGFDLMHSHGYKGNILLGFMPKGFRRLPMITTLHGYMSTGGITRMRFYEWLDRAVLRRLERVVLVSETMKSHPRLSALKGTHYTVIQNGISEVGKRGEHTSESYYKLLADFCENGFIIGAVGRLSPEKGFDCLIEAFGKVAGNAPEAKLVILGEGRMREMLEAKVTALGLADRVLMPGYVSNAAGYMGFFDIFVLSSITEGLPMTLLEAMHEALPIVSTKAGGVVNVLLDGETGLLVPHSDPSALAAGIKKLYLDADLRQTLGSAARQEGLGKYSSQQMTLKYLAVYRDVLQNRPQRYPGRRQADFAK